MEKMSSEKISVVLPTYNEKENIERIICSLEKECGRYVNEIIVVDDNSPDGTWQIVKNLKKKVKKLRLIRRIGASGLPSAIIEGIKNARNEYVLWMDCDLSHPPKTINEMINHIGDYDVVIASKYAKGGKDCRGFMRVATSKILNIFGSLILQIDIKDLTSGFYLVKKGIFKSIKLKDDGYAEYCIKFAWDISKKGYRVREVPYVVIDRKDGHSKSYRNILNFIKNGYLCAREILRLRFSGR